MFEVREEKSKSGSEAEESEAPVKHRYVCSTCKKAFKNERALKKHESACKTDKESTSGVVVLEEDDEMATEEEAEEEDEISELEGELESIEPEVKEVGKGVSYWEIENLSRELSALEADLNTKVDFSALNKMSRDYEDSMKDMESSMSTLTQTVEGVMKEIRESGRKFGTYQNIVKEMKKLDEKIIAIFEEIGFGESLNVAKIPPNILESVYESTIEDIVNEIRRNYGSQDTERIITNTLEDIRTRTSGSELFFFDGRTLKTRNLVNVIEKRLISARQVQTTYDELLGKLLEYLPGYKAKNFRALIKLKSQEYAVDKSTFLVDGFYELRDDLDKLKVMVGSLTNAQDALDIKLDELKDSKVGIEQVLSMKATLEEITAKQSEFGVMLGELKEHLEADKSVLMKQVEIINDRLETLEEPSSKKKQRAPAKKSDETPENIEDRILEMIPEEGFTAARIKKELKGEIKAKDVDVCLKSLVDKGVLNTEKRGKYISYIPVKNKRKRK